MQFIDFPSNQPFLTLFVMETDTINVAIELWKKVNLSELQKELDVQSLDVFKTQSNSLENRKKLAERTREFKKIEQPSNNEIKSLLKEYQAEIDSINKRSKNAESAFLNLYKVLAEVPDPCPLLVSAVTEIKSLDQVDQIKQENQILRDKVDALNRELLSEKQNESLIKNLSEKVQHYESLVIYFDELETMVSERVAEATLELQNEMEEKIKVYKET